MTDDERRVRDVWTKVEACESMFGYRVRLPTRLSADYERPSDAWDDARKFTDRLAQEIGEAKRCVSLLTSFMARMVVTEDALDIGSVLSREQARLAYLVRGTKWEGQ